MMQEAQKSASAQKQPAPGEGKMWTVPAWLGKKCGACSLSCSVAYETSDGEPTGIVRLSNMRPLPDDLPVLRFNVADYEPTNPLVINVKNNGTETHFQPPPFQP